MGERLWCQRCDRYPDGNTTVELERSFDGHRFRGKVSAQRCLKCGQKYPRRDADEDLNRRIALRLTRSWPAGPAALKLMREVIGLPAKELASLLGVTPETVSRWEHGKLTPGRQTMALLAELVASPKHSRARSTLEALRDSGPLPALILLERG